MNNKDIYKIYQLMEFFTNKYSFNNVMVKAFIAPNEIWLSNSNRDDINVIRISLSTLDETYMQRNRIDSFLDVVKKTFKKELSFVDIHVSNEEVTNAEYYKTSCLNSSYYSGYDLNECFPGIDKVIHDVENAESELANRIASINAGIKQSLKIQKNKFKSKFNINATSIIIVLCILSFILTSLLSIMGFSQSSCLIVAGADYKFFTLGLKQFYRLITYSFVHSSLIHLFFNMYSLYVLGNYVEKKYGTVKFLSVLFISILVGGLSHEILTDNQLIIGMSGGIYGLFAIYVIDAIKMGAYRNSVFVIMILINIALNFMSNIAWQTHLGGAIVGILFSYMYKDSGKLDKKIYALLGILIVILFIKMISIKSITPLYLGTDSEVVNVYSRLGLKNYSLNLKNRIYNYYMNH